MNAIITKAILTASAAAAFALAAFPAAAQAGEVANRINYDQYRINHGVRDGQMTFGEYANTEWRLRHVAAQRNFYLRTQGGHLTYGEYVQLNRELNGESRSIYFDNHNWPRQWGAPLR